DRLAKAREEGMAAYERKDYPAALEHLGHVVSRRKDDHDALMAYARSRVALPMDRGRHLFEGKDAFQLALQHRPGDADVQRELLKLYPAIGYWTEARALADEVLARDPADADALRARAESLAAQREFDKAYDTAAALAKQVPTDVAAQRLVVRLMYEMKRPAADIRGYADGLRTSHPDDPRFEYVTALSRQDDARDAAAWLAKAAARPAPDAAFARLLAGTMEQAGMFDQARQYLQNQAAGDGELLALLCQRLWQDGKYTEVVDRLKSLDPADPTVESDLLALRAMSLYQIAAAANPTTRPAADPAASAIVDALAARKKDSAAQTWAKALDARFRAPPADAAQLAKVLTEALTGGRDVAAVRYMLAEAHAEQGEAELALTNFRAAAALMPSWAQPHVRASQVLLATGRTKAAFDEALAAMRRAPNTLAANAAYCHAWFAKYNENPTPEEAARLLQYAELIHKQSGEFGQPQTLPVYVTMLALAGRADDATAVVRKALSAPRPMPAEAMAKLAEACRRERLPVVDEVVTAAVGGARTDTPGGALTTAARLAMAGRPADGLAQLL
ncbi:MAG TPA: hypothetical protein VK324_08775, partial [Tepidisphaeraceae bacterium]|nr:hypothetical protein [Tepidisphaeraceae bacterium]